MMLLEVISERDQAYGNTLQVWTDGWSELTDDKREREYVNEQDPKTGRENVKHFKSTSV